MATVKDFLTLAVILAVFVCAAALATALSVPVYLAAKGSDALAVMAVVWMVACYVGSMLLALRVLARYRAAIGE